jgi:hypothetical protein
MKRRAYLGLVAGSGIVLVSGCLVADDGSEETPSGDDPEADGDDKGGPGDDAVGGPEAVVESFLDAENSATYTSFRRTLAGCFHELAANAEDDRREVLVPAFCSSDFPDAIEGVGLETVRYDVDPGTLAFDAASVEDGLRTDPLAVVAINVLGYGSPMADLADRCAVRETAADYADDAVLEVATGEDVSHAVTNDQPLRDRLLDRGVPVIGLRGRNKLAITQP